MANTKSQRRREQRRKQKATTATQAAGHTAVTTLPYTSVRPIASLSDELDQDQYTRLYGILLGQRNRKHSNGPRTVIAGSVGDETLRTWLDGILSMPVANGTSYRDRMRSDIVANPGFMAIERKQQEKFGPFVEPTWPEIREKLADYFGEESDISALYHSDFSQIPHLVAQELIAANEGTPLSPATVIDAFEAMPKHTYFGYPHFTSKWSEERSIALDLVDFVDRLMLLEPEAVEQYHALPWEVFNRVVPNGSSSKVRATMAPSKYGALYEKCFTMPIIEAFKRTHWAKGYAGNHVVEGYIRHAVRNNDVVFSADYSSYDQTMKKSARHYVKEVLKLAFGGAWDDHLDVMFAAFDSPEVITPDGVYRTTADFGLGSGIGPTGCIGSVWNRVVYHYLRIRAYKEYGVNLSVHFGYGDDTLLCWNGYKIPLTWFSSAVGELGMILNPDKQEYTSGDSRYASFLARQYYYCPSIALTSHGVYSAYRAWARLIHKDVQIEQEDKWVAAERARLSSVGCDMLDTIALLEECKNHPYHSDLVMLVMDAHPLRLKSTHYLRDHSLGTTVSEYGDGLKVFRTVRFVTVMESRLIETYGGEETHWQRDVLRRYAKAIWRQKGFVLTTAQALAYLKGEDVKWTTEQLAITVAHSAEARKPLVERVMEIEQRKGVVLLPVQIKDLAEGRKIRWSEAQREGICRFGNFTKAEKDAWLAKIRKDTSTRQVVYDRPQFDFEELWAGVLFHMGSSSDSSVSDWTQSMMDELIAEYCVDSSDTAPEGAGS